uniref:DNA-directed RNA polymerase I subunit RPA49 n=1 Tax=Cacopsylla melanoneura TaxID=428564 RepID=A0A8D9EKX7_9HEMI
MGKCKITQVLQHSKHATNPILIGWDPGMLKDEMMPSAVCTLQKEPGSTGCSSIQVNLGQGAQGVVYEGNIDTKPLCRTFIAIRSKNKKKPTHSKVKLYEASSTLLVEQQAKTTPQTTFGDIDRMDKFYKVFGSKKGFRQHETMKKMNIVKGNVREKLRESLVMAKTEEEENEDNSESIASSFHSILPPCNRNAAVKEDVYTVDSIIPEYIMLELEEDAQFVADCLKKSTPLSEEDYSSFFINNVSAIVKSSVVKIEPDDLKQRVKLLIFCELLLKLINSNSKRDLERAKFTLIAKLPSTNQYILDNYARLDGARRVLSRESQDKVLCHVIILTVLACCYVFNVQTLCSSAPFSAEKLAPMLQLVGLTPAPNSDRRLYVMKTPLPPLPSGGGAKRGGVGMKRKRN